MMKKIQWWLPVLAGALSFGTMGANCGGTTTDMTKWVVITCKFPEVADLPPEAAHLQELFDGTDGLAQYYRDVSYGRYAPTFHRIETWVTLPYSQDEDKTLSRYDRIQRCVDAQEAADPNFHSSDYYGIIAMRNGSVDAGNAGQVLVDTGAYNVTFLEHETGHTLGFGHSFDMSDRKDADWSAPGEYFDYWDVMSAMNVYDFTNVNGFTAGPNLSTSYKLMMGWLDQNQVRRMNVAQMNVSSDPVNVNLLRYDAAASILPQSLVVEGLPNGEFLTAEYRKVVGWDRAFPYEGVLIHRVKLGGTRPYVTDGGPRQPGESYVSPEGVSIEVLNSLDSGNQMQIRVSLVVPPAGSAPAGSEGSSGSSTLDLSAAPTVHYLPVPDSSGHRKEGRPDNP